MGTYWCQGWRVNSGILLYMEIMAKYKCGQPSAVKNNYRIILSTQIVSKGKRLFKYPFAQILGNNWINGLFYLFYHGDHGKGFIHGRYCVAMPTIFLSVYSLLQLKEKIYVFGHAVKSGLILQSHTKWKTYYSNFILCSSLRYHSSLHQTLSTAG